MQLVCRALLRLSRHAWLICVLLLLLPGMAAAQTPHFPASDRADIQAFTFTEPVFNHLQDAIHAARTMHIRKTHLDMGKIHSLADMAAQLTASDPRIKPLLARYDFTPRQFLVANLALISTVMTMRRFAGTPQAAEAESHLNPANVRFYQAHKAAMDALMNPGPASGASGSAP